MTLLRSRVSQTPTESAIGVPPVASRSMSRSFPDGRPLGRRLRLHRLRLSPWRNSCNDFPQKAPPLPAPSQPEPTAPDASPLLLPRQSAQAAHLGRTGDDARTALSNAVNLTPRHTP